MNLKKDIPLLTRWHYSKAGKWVAKYGGGSAMGVSWIIAVPVFFLVYLALFETDSRAAGTILFVLAFVWFLVSLIFVEAAKEERPFHESYHMAARELKEKK